MTPPAGSREPSARRWVLGMRLDATTYAAAVQNILQWARDGESRYVCAANVHMTMEAADSSAFRDIVNAADLVTPDGVPLVWVLRTLGVRHATRVYGPDLMKHVCRRAAAEGLSVGLYGGRPDVLAHLVERLRRSIPELDVAFAESPPFRPLGAEEDVRVVERVRAAGVRILFVGLGCPKQERWMASHRGTIPAVMLGVGAAFDFISGAKPQAPPWLQRACLEWLFRLATEPRRLWRRYLVHNPRFVAQFLLQFVHSARDGDPGVGRMERTDAP